MTCVSRRLLGGAVLALAAPAVRAQSRPVRIVVPYAPGGQSDTVVRLIQPKMSEALGQTIVVENRPGGGGTIGASAVVASPADGTTLLFESYGFITQPLIQTSLTYDHEHAFMAIGQAVELPYVLVVKAAFPANDLAGYINEAKRQNGIPFGSPGIGSIGHLAGALLAHRAGVQLEHIPYRGGTEAARDIVGGNLDSAISSANSLRPLVVEGKAKGIALTSGTRRGTLSNLPTIAESGFPGFDFTSWNGMFAPAGTPAPVIARMNEAMRAATSDPGVRERLAASGNDPVSGSAEQFAALVARDRETVRNLVRETRLQLQ
ncbi:tripartite tricarboxylate transporter substrate binding protein [Rhodovarius crocodyli]|uniref:Tripartite tricarboxylate transporter substrate binding protein n=1 Tax=Rhodovarius crocodyli TaxID=1979269 RepID=A0A437M3N5_9PROT|nr:tripartite tricarboxylate transporter substrate binding protein [Rhodovarius crocodyli]RVT92321.1 tripartite tricarboxylate transporter substrate binding protein [Rhodovarius crocodyli]